MAEITLKVSAKAAVSLYGLRRLPITLYAYEWEKILLRHAEIMAFIRDHESELSRKDSYGPEADCQPAAGGKTFSQVMGWQR